MVLWQVNGDRRCAGLAGISDRHWSLRHFGGPRNPLMSVAREFLRWEAWIISY